LVLFQSIYRQSDYKNDIYVRSTAARVILRLISICDLFIFGVVAGNDDIEHHTRIISFGAELRFMVSDR